MIKIQLKHSNKSFSGQTCLKMRKLLNMPEMDYLSVTLMGQTQLIAKKVDNQTTENDHSLIFTQEFVSTAEQRGEAGVKRFEAIPEWGWSKGGSFWISL